MNDYTQREQMIRNYVEAYNRFDVDGMVKDMAEDIVFQNESSGQVSLRLEGLAAFRQQAEQAASFFTMRRQTIRSFQHQEAQTIVNIDYHAVIAVNSPNGWKKGDELTLSGQSIFQFQEGMIVALTDIS
jgi:ketosteroid isomerase-like protein